MVNGIKNAVDQRCCPLVVDQEVCARLATSNPSTDRLGCMHDVRPTSE